MGHVDLTHRSRVVCAAIALFVGCGGDDVVVPASELVVVVDTDALLPCELDAIEIQVIGPSGPLETITAPLEGEGAEELPLTLGLYQAGDADGPVEVVARGMRAGSRVLEHRVRTRFLAEQRLELPMTLARACAAAFCEDEGMTCNETGCVAVDVTPGTLSAWDGEVPPSMRGECTEMGLGGDGTCPGSMGDVVALPTMRDAVERGSLGPGSMTFSRPEDPFAGNMCPAGPTEATSYYEPWVVCNAGPPRSYEIALSGSCTELSTTLEDPVLFVYAGESIPADPRMCLAVNDDDQLGSCPDSKLTVMLDTNQIVTVVATEFYGITEGGGGTYKLTFTPL